MRKIFVLFFVLIFSNLIYASTTITSTAVGGSDLTSTGLVEFAEQIQEKSDRYGPVIANGYAIVNSAGYLVGSSILGSFPSLFLGFSLNGALAFPEEGKRMYAVNPAVYFGLGLSKKMDVMGKLMLYNDGFYNPSTGSDMLVFEKINLYSVGAKIRYLLVEKKAILPGLFNFGGITASVGFDYMYGNINFTGVQNIPLGQIEADPDGAGGFPASSIDLSSDTNYDIKTKWYMLTTQARVLAYVDIFWIFGFYSGFGANLNYGSFDIDATLTGNVTTTDAAYILANGGSGDVAIIDGLTKNSYTPYYIIPEYVFGLELNLVAIRFNFETAVNLRNSRDVNLQFGVRVQY